MSTIRVSTTLHARGRPCGGVKLYRTGVPDRSVLMLTASERASLLDSLIRRDDQGRPVPVMGKVPS